MSAITVQQVALGLGVSGALSTVSQYVEFNYGIQHFRGKQSEFVDGTPGTIQFVLNNRDGRFTPGSSVSPYPTPLTEGAAVSWNAGGRLQSGTVRGFQFAGSESSWGELTVLCDDQLGSASRFTMKNSLPDAITVGAGQLLLWRLDDAAGSSGAREANGGQQLVPTTNGSVVFGVPTITGLPGTAATISATGSADGLVSAGVASFTYPAVSSVLQLGCWNMWFPSGAGSSTAHAVIGYIYQPASTPIPQPLVTFGADGAGHFYATIAGGTTVTTAVTAGPHLVAVVVTASVSTFTATLYVDGVSIASSTFAGTVGVTGVSVGLYVNSGTTATVARLSHTTTLAHEETAIILTEKGRLNALDAVAAELTLATLPTSLSTAPIGYGTEAGQSILDALNAVIRTEQGYLYTTTTGTLLAPVQKITVRERTRPAAVTYTFDAVTEVSGLPQFIRDITNMVSSVNVSGPNSTATLVNDPTGTAAARVGTANTTETILNTGYVDQLAYGQDRIIRGLNVNLKIVQLNIDSITTPTDRSTALLAVNPGDRISVINLPTATTLGFTTWDGWVTGVAETHQGGPGAQNLFTFYLQPVLPATGVFDTDRWMSDGNNKINVPILAAATTMTVISADLVTYMERVTFPYTLLIESEQVTVSAATAPSAGVQTLTIARGANGTTAAAHSTVAVDVIPAALYAF